MIEKSRLHRTFFAYAGTYAFEGGKVTHTIDTAWNDARTGTTQVRQVEQRGRQLVYTTTPFKFSVDGLTSIITLVWKKYP